MREKLPSAIALALLAAGLLFFFGVRPHLGTPGDVGSRPQPGLDPVVPGDVLNVLGEDGIRSIDQPSFTAAREAGLLPSAARVIGVAAGGEARAYPIAILSDHEIVNDQVGGVPLAVTW